MSAKRRIVPNFTTRPAKIAWLKTNNPGYVASFKTTVPSRLLRDLRPPANFNCRCGALGSGPRNACSRSEARPESSSSISCHPAARLCHSLFGTLVVHSAAGGNGVWCIGGVVQKSIAGSEQRRGMGCLGECIVLDDRNFSLFFFSPGGCNACKASRALEVPAFLDRWPAASGFLVFVFFLGSSDGMAPSS